MNWLTENNKKLRIALTLLGYSFGVLGVYLKLNDYSYSHVMLVVAIIFLFLKWVIANKTGQK